MKQVLRIVDLTHEFLMETASEPTSLPGKDSGVHRTKLQSFLGTFLGTRVDAPAIVLDGAKTIDLFGPEAFVHDAVLLDLSDKKAREPIDDEDLEAAEERAGVALREGEMVLVQTGWERFYPNHDYWLNYPVLSENAAQYLEFKHVAALGVDTPSVDSPDSKTLPVHTILLRKEILVFENLCNLNRLSQTRFQLIALPLKVKAASAPVRAIAMLDGI